MKIIIGLGNPGNQYKYNRHNVGFRCISLLAKRYSISAKRISCHADTYRGTTAGAEILLAKPRTFVNLSGKAVACLMDKYHAPASDLIVVHDDLDLPTGRLRIRSGGGSGGHRGIRSIIECTGSEAFCRVRIGISRPDRYGSTENYDNDIVDYVLGDLDAAEEDLMKPTLAAACDAIEVILTDGIETAMNQFNRRF